MGRDGTATRKKILEESQALIFEQGFVGTSVDDILERTGITKGAFFYHFKSKAELARELLKNYVEMDLGEKDNALKFSESLEDEPIKRLLRFVQYFIESMAQLEEPPSCLYASYGYEFKQFTEDVRKNIAEVMLIWRVSLTELIQSAIEVNKPTADIDVESLADHFTAIIEGAFVMSKALNDPTLTSKQLIHYQNYLKLLFS